MIVVVPVVRLDVVEVSSGASEGGSWVLAVPCRVRLKLTVGSAIAIARAAME